MNGNNEIDLSVYLGRLWRGKRLIIPAFVIAAAIGVVVSRFMPDNYVCRSVVLVEQVQLGTVTVAGNERAVTTDTFIHFFTNDDVLNEVLEKTNLRDRDNDGIATIRGLKSRINVRTGRNTSLIELSVSMPTPELAKDVADALVAGAVELNRELMNRNINESISGIEKELDRLTQEADERDAKYLDHQAQALIETALQRFGQAEIERRTLREDYSKSLANMAEKEEQYRLLVSEAGLESATKVLYQNILSQPAVLAVLKEVNPRSSLADIVGVRLRSEIENVLYNKIHGEIVDVTASYQGSCARYKELKTLIEQLDVETKALERKYHEDLTKSMRLQRERDASHEALAAMIKTRAESAGEVFWEQQRLQVLAPPVKPDEPDRPSGILVGAGSGFIGVILGMIMVLSRGSRSHAGR